MKDNFPISRRIIYKILKKYGLKHYKPRMVQKLYHLDKWKRKDFCLWLQKQINWNKTFGFLIIFTDESIFYLNGRINKQTSLYWASKNPNFTSDTNIIGDKKIMVWIGIWGTRIIVKSIKSF